MPTYRGRRFTDASLLGLAKIETIRQIALYDTAVSDDGLIEFSRRAKRLNGFHMSSKALSDEGLAAILTACPITNLQIHDARGVTDAVAPLIAKHTNIMELYLNGTSIGDATAEALEKMPNVWSFCANGTHITDVGLASLGRMPELSLVCLKSTRIRGHGLRHLSALDGLDIYLEECPVSDDGLALSLPSLTNVRGLSLSKTGLSDVGLTSIGCCRRLESLSLDDTTVTDKTLEPLAELTELASLSVRRTKVTARAVAKLQASNGDLSICSDFDESE